MPLFMDVHNLGTGVTMDDVAQAHQADLTTQGDYDVSYLRYWVDQDKGRSSASSRHPMPGPPARSTARPTAWSPMRSTRYKKAPDTGTSPLTQPGTVRARHARTAPLERGQTDANWC